MIRNFVTQNKDDHISQECVRKKKNNAPVSVEYERPRFNKRLHGTADTVKP
ncbi:hypothetical protein BgiMline_019587, partial [Biomphalaria glabrata]